MNSENEARGGAAAEEESVALFFAATEKEAEAEQPQPQEEAPDAPLLLRKKRKMEGARAAVVATAIPAAVAEPKAARNLARPTTVGKLEQKRSMFNVQCSKKHFPRT